MRDNDLQEVMNVYTEDLVFISNYNGMIDNKYEIQMSKAIDLAQMKSRLVELLMLLVYILAGYQINTMAYLQGLF